MTLAATVGPTGISAPTYAEILVSLQNSFKAIYGSDAYIAPDSQDGQMIAVFAKAIDDSNQMAVDTYNAFSPTFAQGAGLSSVVKINGITRLIASFSQAVGNAVGVVGTVITNGVVKDENGNLWDLPASVIIPGAGTISVTVTAQKPGAIAAPAGAINAINTPTLGWQTFVSSADASPGNPVETDAALRQRQTVSTEIPSESPLQGLLGAISNLAGVTRARVYENYTEVVDANGLPPHSISAVVEGGSAAAIAEIIGQKKTMGAFTFGDESQTYTDPVSGIVYTINYNALDFDEIEVAVTGTAKAGYSTLIGTQIKNSIAAYINALAIGQDVEYLRMFAPAYLNGLPEGQTYEITALTIAINEDAPGVIDLPIPYNVAAFCDAASSITVTIT